MAHGLRSLLRWSLAGVAVSVACTGARLSPEQESRLATFDQYWEALDEHYPYFGDLRFSWEESRERYRAAAAALRDEVGFCHLLAGMLSELEDSHVSLEPNASFRERTTAPLGLEIEWIDGRFYAIQWPRGEAPAEPDWLAGPDRWFPEVVAVEGYPISRPLLPLLLLGHPGSKVEIDLCWPDGTLSRHAVHRDSHRSAGAMSASGALGARMRYLDAGSWTDLPLDPDDPGALAPYRQPLHETGRAVRLDIGAFTSADLPDVVFAEKFTRWFDAAMRFVMEAGPDALVIDLRDNPGGITRLAWHVASYLIDHDVSHISDFEALDLSFAERLLLSRFAFDGRYVEYLRVHRNDAVFRGRLIVLVSECTASAAEDLALMLQREADAVVVGSLTAGAEASVKRIAGADGSAMRFGAVRQVDLGGRGIQSSGVVPNVPIRVTIDELRRAKEQTEQGFARRSSAREWYGAEKDERLSAALDGILELARTSATLGK